MDDYLWERQIDSSLGDSGPKSLTGGVPQGSVLGPLLWNVLFDDVLRVRLPAGAQLAAYADDLVLIVAHRELEVVREQIEEATRAVNDWISAAGLVLERTKTEILLFTGRRKISLVEFQVAGHTVQYANEVKYLGLVLDRHLNFGKHTAYAAARAGKALSALSKVMPNVCGPASNRRRAYAAVVSNILLYGSEVWGEAVLTQKYKEKLLVMQRAVALRVCSAYRTVSREAALVVSGLIAVDLLALERREKWANETKQKVLRESSLQAWQQRWYWQMDPSAYPRSETLAEKKAR